MTYTLEISEEARQLMLLALAVLVAGDLHGPRTGFDHAAKLAAAELRGVQMYEHFKLCNTDEADGTKADQPVELGGES